MIMLEIVCPFCGDVNFVAVLESDWERYQSGDLTQNCFPYLDPEEREMIISHMCPECQARVFWN